MASAPARLTGQKRLPARPFCVFTYRLTAARGGATIGHIPRPRAKIYRINGWGDGATACEPGARLGGRSPVASIVTRFPGFPLPFSEEKTKNERAPGRQRTSRELLAGARSELYVYTSVPRDSERIAAGARALRVFDNGQN